MGLLYVKDSKLLASDYVEVYIPMEYFDNNSAVNRGVSMETFGIVYIRGFSKGEPGNVQLLNIPAIINLMVYNTKQEVIRVKDRTVKVTTLMYPKDSYVMNKSLQQGREVAEVFLDSVLAGKLPPTLDYASVINIWWYNMEIAGVDFKVPSKIYEMIIATTYRNKNNFKERFGQSYGKNSNSNGYNYETGNVRDIVESLSTFSGMVFEDMGRMITSGLNNNNAGLEEPVSPLEKIIYY